MLIRGEEICHVDRCTRPGCSPSAGCQGHAAREAVLDRERKRFEAWMSDGGEWPKAVERSGEGYRLMQSSYAWTVWKAATEADKA